MAKTPLLERDGPLRRLGDDLARAARGDGVTWIPSYVNPGRTKTFCVYDAPTPEAIRKSADRNGLPVDVITEGSVLDPYLDRS